MTEEEAALVHLSAAEGADMRVSWIGANFEIGIGSHDENVVGGTH